MKHELTFHNAWWRKRYLPFFSSALITIIVTVRNFHKGID